VVKKTNTHNPKPLVRTAHVSVFLTGHSCSTPYHMEQFPLISCRKSLFIMVYREFNTVFGKIGRSGWFRTVIIQLINSTCLPCLCGLPS